MTSMTTSVEDPPSWSPKLPPSIAMDPGELHPSPALRHEANPRPYLPPTPKAPFFKPGTMITHLALSNSSWGMPLSGVFISSRKVSVAFLRRLSGLASCARRAVAAIQARRTDFVISTSLQNFVPKGTNERPDHFFG